MDIYFIEYKGINILRRLDAWVIDKVLYKDNNIPSHITDKFSFCFNQLYNVNNIYTSICELLRWHDNLTLDLAILLDGDYKELLSYKLPAETYTYMSKNVKNSEDIWRLINTDILSVGFNLKSIANRKQLKYIKRKYPEL